MEPIQYSFVIPCYNEEDNLPILIKRCQEILVRDDMEIILVDNGSTDHTQQVLAELLGPATKGLSSMKVGINQGYGFGIKAGLARCKGQFLGWTHADLQTDVKDFLKAIELIEANKNITNLYVKGRRYGRNLIDVIFTWAMSLFELMVLGVWIPDINAQPNLFTRTFYNNRTSWPDDFSLDLFVVYQAYKANQIIKIFPVYFGKRVSGIGHNDTLKDKFKFSWRATLFSFKLRKLIKNNR